MSSSEKLAWLVENMFTVSINANDHRTSAESVAQKLEHQPENYDDMDPAVRAECISRNQLVELYVYPSNSVGSYSWAHYDVNAAIAEAFEFLSQRSERYEPNK